MTTYKVSEAAVDKVLSSIPEAKAYKGCRFSEVVAVKVYFLEKLEDTLPKSKEYHMMTFHVYEYVNDFLKEFGMRAWAVTVCKYGEPMRYLDENLQESLLGTPCIFTWNWPHGTTLWHNPNYISKHAYGAKIKKSI